MDEHQIVLEKMKKRAEERRKDLEYRKNLKGHSVNEWPLYLKLQTEIPEWQLSELEQRKKWLADLRAMNQPVHKQNLK